MQIQIDEFMSSHSLLSSEGPKLTPSAFPTVFREKISGVHKRNGFTKILGCSHVISCWDVHADCYEPLNVTICSLGETCFYGIFRCSKMDSDLTSIYPNCRISKHCPPIASALASVQSIIAL